MRLGIGLGLCRPVARSAFVPTLIAGCMLWLRADLGVTIATGVSVWADQSGTGDANKNVTQVTGSKQPTRNATDASYNNQATLGFASASSQVLVSGTWATPLAMPETIILVGNFSGAAVNQYMSDSLTPDRHAISTAGGITNAQAYNGNPLSSGTAVSASPEVVLCSFNGASSTIYVSASTVKASGDTGAGGSRNGLTVGSAGSDAGAYLNGKIAEVIVYNSALGSTDRATLWSYLGARYGIAIGA